MEQRVSTIAIRSRRVAAITAWAVAWFDVGSDGTPDSVVEIPYSIRSFNVLLVSLRFFNFLF
jgi:hypothetical protein